MIKRNKSKKAITLVELVIVLSLMSIVTMLVFNFVSISQRQSKSLEIKQELQHDGNMISESMMKNILHCKSIEKVEGVNPSSTNDNSIKSITINLNGEGYFLSQPSITDVEQVEYRLVGNELRLIAWQRVNSGDTNLTEREIQTIVKNVKEIKIVNKDILSQLVSKPLNSTEVKEEIKKQKGINLEILLEKEGIVHKHTFELNLRNAN
ncbi:type II secretion system protein [Clostridium massiliamazoniense]|uniref:type II secretion system protein n=1 Tax=Clostridium massiliamazoniense TaxID=1347366 RepID=UPI0006D856CB|nr:type II secretion system protein [Clostridium massiliamazoniense]